MGSRLLGLAAVLAAAVPLAASAATARGWTLIDIGTLGGPSSYGAAISNSGFVAGCADLADGTAHAFLYKDGVMKDLGSGATAGRGGGSASGNSCALAVNNQGTAAGRSASGELVVWADATVTGIGVQGDVGGLDDNGTVVGSSGEGTARRAFMFANGKLTSLGSLGAGGESHATRINAHAQIVGSSNGHAFIYENGAMRDLGTLGGAVSAARGLNDFGQIVGMSSTNNGQPAPFIFDGAMRALEGPGYSHAIAINNRGQVVGSAEGSFGYLLDNGEYLRLDTIPEVKQTGWRRLEPTGINDRGWIVGTAATPTGELRAFLLVPLGVYSSRRIAR
jgi:probable HAF family extracellular repeat protein